MANTSRVFFTRSLPGDAPPARLCAATADLWEHERLPSSPHPGGATERTLEHMTSLAPHGPLAAHAGERPLYPATAAAWERWR